MFMTRALIELFDSIKEYRKARAERIQAEKELEELIERKKHEAIDKKLKELEEWKAQFDAQLEEAKKNDPMKAELERYKRTADLLLKDCEGV